MIQDEKDIELGELKRAFMYIKPAPYFLPIAIILFVLGILYYVSVFVPTISKEVGKPEVLPLAFLIFGAVLAFGRYYLGSKAGTKPADSYMQESKRIKDRLRKLDTKNDDKAIEFRANTFYWVGSLYDKYVCFIIYKRNNSEFVFFFKNEFEIIKNPLPRKDYTFVIGKNKIRGTIDQFFWTRYYNWKNT